MTVGIELRLIDEAVAIIIGERPEPKWLRGRLTTTAETIRNWRLSENSAPTRKDTRARLNEFRSAVEVLKDGISDPAFNVFLGHGWITEGASYAQIMRCFDELSIRANQAALRLSGQGGIPQAFPTDRSEYVSAHELCAWTVMHAIALSRQAAPAPTNKKHVKQANTEEISLPGPDNADAQQAANLLWRMAGEIALGSRDGKRLPTGWREHFIAVKEAEAAGDRRSGGLRSMLKEFQGIALAEIETPA